MKKTANPKDTARKLANAKKAGELRAQGLTYRQIAAELGIGRSTVGDLLGESKALALAEMTEHGHVIRDMEDARLLEIIEAGWAMVQDIAGRVDKDQTPVSYKAAAALTTVLRASESRRKLWGVDAPTKIEATTTRVELPDDDQAAEILAKLPPL